MTEFKHKNGYVYMIIDGKTTGVFQELTPEQMEHHLQKEHDLWYAELPKKYQELCKRYNEEPQRDWLRHLYELDSRPNIQRVGFYKGGKND